MADAPDSGCESPIQDSPHLAKIDSEAYTRSPETPPHGAVVGHSSGQPFRSGNAGDVVEAALAKALEGAAAACRFDVVAQLAKELEARRMARSENVVDLAARRERR